MKSRSEFKFVTGGAGSGKTTYIRENLATGYKLTATTGTAAINLGSGATTINTALGYGNLDDISPVREIVHDRLLKIVRQNYRGLVIDEISMMRPHTLQAIYNECQDVELDLIVVGDFAQLPPVVKDGKPISFAFQAPCWNDASTIFLPRPGDEHKTRQSSDPLFFDALNELRRGQNDEMALSLLLKAGVRFVNVCDPYFPGFTLFYLRGDVADFNATRFKELGGPSKSYRSSRSGVIDSDLSIPDSVDLKIGAKVRATDNCWIGGKLLYSNGDLGIVREMGDKFVVVELFRGGSVNVEWMVRKNEINIHVEARIDNEGNTYKVRVADEIGRLTYMPLELGWASTVHKAQGVTAAWGVQAWLGRVREGGMLYTIASRCQRGKDLVFVGTPQDFLKACTAYRQVNDAGYLDLVIAR